AAARDRVVLVLLDGTGGDFPTPFANAVAVVQPEYHAAILEQWNDPDSVQAIVDLVMDSLPSVVKPDAVLEEPQARIFEKDFRFEAFSCGARNLHRGVPGIWIGCFDGCHRRDARAVPGRQRKARGGTNPAAGLMISGHLTARGREAAGRPWRFRLLLLLGGGGAVRRALRTVSGGALALL